MRSLQVYLYPLSIIFALTFGIACQPEVTKDTKPDVTKTVAQPSTAKFKLNLEQATRLAALPLKCMQHEFPNKLNQTLETAADVQNPSALHPAFYGCFDWHSAVHGHWMLVELLKRFPQIETAAEIKNKLAANISTENILAEVAYFNGAFNTSFERTYGWAWLLKLSEALYTWDDPLGKTLHKNLAPLSQLIRDRYIEFLPKLYYPIRVGEHSNTGFGISFAWDYAQTIKDDELADLIETRARDWFLTDEACPLGWEPSGFDFLSPCLEEADIMSRVLSPFEFNRWLNQFLPQLFKEDFQLAPGQVTDRSDGKLVHLDGLNFSRAWVLYRLANQGYANPTLMTRLANEHMEFSLPNMIDGDYAGEHWLASFALYALISAE